MINAISERMSLWINKHKTQTILLFIFLIVGFIILIGVAPHFEETLKIIDMILLLINIGIHIIDRLKEKESRNYPYLRRIQSVLERNEENEGRFFRKGGPLWIDFQDGYVFRLAQVDNVKDAFKAGIHHVMLVGDAASGKSVVARNIGYELANECDVFYIDSKVLERYKVDDIFESILKLTDNSLVIIEDTHSYPEYFSDLLKQVKDKGKTNFKILFTSRPTYDRPGIDSSGLKYCTKFTLKSFESAEPIIKKYVEKKNLPSPSAEEIEELKKQSENLWILAYFLMAWEPGKPVEIDQVYNKVYDDLKSLDTKYKGSSQVILALAPFYQYEISVKRLFLTSKLNIDDGTIQKLICAGEIKESKGLLSLLHSSLAKIYIDTCEKYPELIEPLLDELDANLKDYDVRIFRYYLGNYKHPNYYYVFRHLASKKGLIRNILKDDSTCKAIYNLLEKETDYGKFIISVMDISEDVSYANHIVVLKLIEIIKLKIENEIDPEKSSNMVMTISMSNEEIARELVQKFNLENFISKIEKEKDVKKIGESIYNIRIAEINVRLGEIKSKQSGVKVAEKIVQKLDLNNLVLKIEKEPDIEKIGRCVMGINSEKMVLDMNNLVLKIEKESDIKKIGRCINSISSASSKVAGDLLHELNLNNLISKIENESDIEKIKNCVEDISSASSEFAGRLVQRLDLNNLISKIEKEPDIVKIEWCVKSVLSASDMLHTGLVEIIISKIEKEPDIEKIGRCISGFYFDCSDIAKILVKKLDLSNIITKVEKEPDIEKIGIIIKDISLANEKIGKEIVSKLNLNIISKIEKEPDIEKIGFFLRNVFEVDDAIECEFIDIVKSKIEKEPDIEKIGSCIVRTISGGRKEFAKAVLQKLDFECLISKIEKEPDIEKIGRSIGYISFVSEKKGLGLFDTITLKMEKEPDIEIVGSCIWYISFVRTELAKALIQKLGLKEEELEKLWKYKPKKFEKNLYFLRTAASII